MDKRFIRTEMVIGSEKLIKLKNSRVIIFGIGGVGSYVAEGLSRAGIGQFMLVDNDVVCVSNINRQIHALENTIGGTKVELMKERIELINPYAVVETMQFFYLPENSQQIDFSGYDYIIDAIDTVTAKIDIIVKAKSMNVPIISCMGTGNKLNPTELEVSDIYKTSVCPLAKVMRKELKDREIKSLKVVYSKEIPKKPVLEDETSNKLRTPGSVSFVPSVAGMIIASEVVKDIIYS